MLVDCIDTQTLNRTSARLSLSAVGCGLSFIVSLRKSAQVLFFVLCWLATIPGLFGQSPDWQPVPKEDLELKDNPANPGSAAMILERRVSTDDENRAQTEWVRIKILTEEGRDYADVEIPYLAKSTTIEDIRGRTVRSDGTVITFSGTVFDKTVLKYKRFRYEMKTFTLPGVEVGSIIEYAYTMRWKDKLPDYVRNPSRYSFQDGWTIPDTTWTIEQTLFTRHGVFSIRPVHGGQLAYARVRLPGVKPAQQPDGSMRLEVNNVAAIEKEADMPPESQLNSRVHFYYQVGYIGNYWQSMSRAKAERAEKFILPTHYLEQAANEITPPSDPPETRMRKLYARVQQIRYLSYETSRTEKEEKREHLAANKSAEDILRHGYAYSNEINFLFAALARAAGFDASIVEVVDRSSAVFEPQVLDTSQLNATVVRIYRNGKNLYFDPATRFCPFGLLPWFESETQGISWARLGGDVADVYPANPPSTIERTADLKLQPDGGLEGELEVVYTGQEALDKRLSAVDEDEAGRRKIIEDEINQWTPPGATIDLDSVTGWDDPEKPLRVKCHLHAARFAVLTQKRMLFPIAVFQMTRKNPLPYTHRLQPVYYRYGFDVLDKITISLPNAYRMEALPAANDYKTSFGEFHAKRTSDANVVQLERHSTLNRYFFPLDLYGSLRQYFDQLRRSDAQKIVLRKAELAQAQ
jgi:Domain of Unknown Function with PDB structure (DUF3857)/Transglutaminase-like superfamily